jgi:NAD(P)-dependent dehydrogenase (short-subunit alcohol dehydrogenase family)
MPLIAKTVLVTGGAKRVGAAISTHLADKGWRVGVHYNRSRDDAEALARKIGGVAVNANLAEFSDAEKLPAAAANALGAPLDAVVNSASVFEYNTVSDFSAAEWARDLSVNLTAPVAIARAFAAGLPPDRTGAVVNLLDQKLWNLNADFFSYTVSKLALEGATRLLARALAPAVRVNGVAPGLCLPSGDQTEAEFKAVAGKYNLTKTPISLDDVAAAVAFLLDNAAVTGQTIIADNGQHMVASDQDVMFTTRGVKK